MTQPISRSGLGFRVKPEAANTGKAAYGLGAPTKGKQMSSRFPLAWEAALLQEGS